MSVRQKVSTPVGSDSCQPARSRSTSSPADSGRLAGFVARPMRMASSSSAACSGSMPSHGGRTPVGGSPVRSVNAVAAREYTSLARLGSPLATSSGAAKPRVPVRRRTDEGEDDSPKSTSTTRPLSVSTRLAGFTSPWTTAGCCPWRCVRADAASASQGSTTDGPSPGRPRAWSRRPRSVPSTQSIAMTYWSPSKKSSRTSGTCGCGGMASSTRASDSSASRSSPALTVRIFRATKRSCWWSSALTTRPSPPCPSTSRSS